MAQFFSAGNDPDLDALMAASGDEYMLAGDEFTGDDIVGDSDLYALAGISTTPDMVGAELVGDDFGDYSSSGEDIVGALVGAAVKKAMAKGGNVNKPQLFKAVQKRPPGQVMRRQFEYRPADYSQWREFPIGFGPQLVAAGANATIVVQPQLPFRSERLIVPSTIGAAFDIIDFRIGKNSQFVAAGAISAVSFSEVGVGVRLMGDTAQVSQQIVLIAQNITAGDVTFRATLIGKALQ